ncbi:MAG: hypothetical protein ABID54_10200 [Pseudomonadota bacterium]
MIKKLLWGIVIGLIALIVIIYFGGGRFIDDLGNKTETIGKGMKKLGKKVEGIRKDWEKR